MLLYIVPILIKDFFFSKDTAKFGPKFLHKQQYDDRSLAPPPPLLFAKSYFTIRIFIFLITIL